MVPSGASLPRSRWDKLGIGGRKKIRLWKVSGGTSPALMNGGIRPNQDFLVF
jgi:hypothetical protein